MSLHDSRILTALIRAKARLALGNGDTRARWTGVVCPACGVDYRSVTAVDGGSVVGSITANQVRKMDVRKTSKAGSAEAILRQCLRNLGYTVAYRQGTLSNEQLAGLMEEVRQYGRAWLRHEATGFVRLPWNEFAQLFAEFRQVLDVLVARGLKDQVDTSSSKTQDSSTRSAGSSIDPSSSSES